MIAPREDLVRRGSLGQPGTGMIVEPGLLHGGTVLRERAVDTVRADVAPDDQQIARRDIRQKPVLVAEGNDAHAVWEAIRAPTRALSSGL